MIFIAHRGNIDGSKQKRENSPEYLLEAMNAGYHVETDVRYKDNRLYLGHETYGLYPITLDFLQDSRIWAHAKTPETLDFLVRNSQVHCFWHQGLDLMTLTSKGFIWSLKNLAIEDKAIWVNIEGVIPSEFGMYAICTDSPKRLKQAYENWIDNHD
jgi:hypothetical protein